MESRLGTMRAVIIVWIGRAVVGAVLALFVSPVAWAFLGGSARHIDGLSLATTLILVEALIAAPAVTFGVSLCGFRLSFVSAFFALAVSGIASFAFARFMVTRSVNDPTGIALPSIGFALWPIGLLLGTLLPAYIVDQLSSSAVRSAPPAPPYSV